MQRLILGLVLLALPAVAAAQTQTIGLFRNDPGTFPGYTLFSPLEYTDTYLIDNQGELVHSWSTPYPIGNMAYLEEDGTLFRTADPGGNDVFVWGGDAGLVQQLDWDGTVLWEFLYSDSTVRLHHDIEVMPNGNVLMIAWEYKSQAECIAAGRDDFLLPDGELWPDHLIEVEPIFPSGGNIVWEWHAWDHLIQDFDPAQNNYGVVEDHPELIDINYMQDPLADWLHFNAVDYNPELDLIAISTPRFDEIWIIDHSTTTAEAAGHTGGARGMGGDILYRWGNPAAHSAGTVADQKLFRQHDVHWIPEGEGLRNEGRIMVFNNGNGRPAGPFSSIDEIITTVDSLGNFPLPPSATPHGPAGPAWTYPTVFDPTFYSGFISGSQRLPNGNTLIMEGATGTMFEVDTLEVKTWEYVVPVDGDGPMYQYSTGLNRTFRAHKYATDYPGLAGRDLTPQGVIELDPTSSPVIGQHGPTQLHANFPNPVRGSTSFAFTLARDGRVRLDVFDVRGRLVDRVLDTTLEAGRHEVTWDAGALASGVYTYVLRSKAGTEAKTLVKLQ